MHLQQHSLSRISQLVELMKHIKPLLYSGKTEACVYVHAFMPHAQQFNYLKMCCTVLCCYLLCCDSLYIAAGAVSVYVFFRSSTLSSSWQWSAQSVDMMWLWSPVFLSTLCENGRLIKLLNHATNITHNYTSITHYPLLMKSTIKQMNNIYIQITHSYISEIVVICHHQIVSRSKMSSSA